MRDSRLWSGFLSAVAVLMLPASVLAQTGFASGNLNAGVAAPGLIGGGSAVTTTSSRRSPGFSGAYSVTRVTTQVLTLGDGTQIRTTNQTRDMRDSEGRTRNENSHEADGAMQLDNISIFDPSGQTQIQLYPLQKLARVTHMRTAVLPSQDTEFMKQNQAFTNALLAEHTDHVGAKVTEFSRESLGTQTIMGMAATGTRTTSVVPAGVQGNDRPLRTVTENWTSTDLYIPLKMMIDDPRNGHTEQIVTEISTTPPDPALFRVPEDYKVFEFNQ